MKKTKGVGGGDGYCHLKLAKRLETGEQDSNLCVHTADVQDVQPQSAPLLHQVDLFSQEATAAYHQTHIMQQHGNVSTGGVLLEPSGFTAYVLA